MREIMRSNTENEFMKAHAISERPTAINERRNFGHWEMDCIDSSKGTKASLLIFYERKTRYVEIMKLASKHVSEMHAAIEYFLKRHPNQVHSVTTDRGHEFTNFDVMMLFDTWQVAVYFTHPYSPAEKGGIERVNRDIRHFFPKGQSFTKTTLVALKAVQDIVNHYPKAVLKWQTPQLCYNQFLQSQKSRQKKRLSKPHFA